MDFRLTDEQKLIRSTVREFAENELAPIAAEIDQNHRYPIETLPKLAQQGLLGIPYPEEWGGAGLDQVSYAIAIEEIARVCATTAIIVETHISLATSAIFSYGNNDQKKSFLPDLASGSKLASFALTEAKAGTDAAQLETTAIRRGDCYILNGSKIFITDGNYSEVFVVFAKTDPDPSLGTRGISAFIVDKGLAGFTHGEGERKLGIRAADTASLYFSDVRLPATALLGEEGEGFKIAMATLDGGRIGIAAQAVGIAQGALDAAIKYAKERIQFGKPIASLQAIQWMLADMSTDIEAARLLTYKAAFLQGTDARFSTEAAHAKLFAAQMATRVASQAIQIHGGNGFTEAYPVERAYRDAKITEIYEGTNEVQRMVISRALLR
jgi:alkylation response protein AidB-like acyl-CoA dehydrogenase